MNQLNSELRINIVSPCFTNNGNHWENFSRYMYRNKELTKAYFRKEKNEKKK